MTVGDDEAAGDAILAGGGHPLRRRVRMLMRADSPEWKQITSLSSRAQRGTSKNAAMVNCNGAVMRDRAIARRPLLESLSACFRIVFRSQFRSGIKPQQDDAFKKPRVYLPCSYTSIRSMSSCTIRYTLSIAPALSESMWRPVLGMFADTLHTFTALQSLRRRPCSCGYVVSSIVSRAFVSLPRCILDALRNCGIQRWLQDLSSLLIMPLKYLVVGSAY